MKKYFLTILILLTCMAGHAASENMIKALDTANFFFEDMQNEEFAPLWAALTSKSKDKIISEILDIATPEENLTEQNLKSDFEQCGAVCTEYWQAFMTRFDPADILERSEWSVSEESSDYIELKLQHKNAESPYLLKLYLEEGEWRLGLIESFWLRNFF